MSKDTVSDWSTTAASNTDVGGVDLAENSMRPRDVNNAIRTMMAQIKTLTGGNTSLREKLTANRTYYVRTDGSDSNTGLVDSAGGAFLTKQKAWDVLCGLDQNTFTVTVQVKDGTYTGNVSTVLSPTGPVVFQGNAGTPANVVVNKTSGNDFSFSGPLSNVVTIKDMELRTTTSGTAINLAAPGVVRFSNIVFGACATYHMQASAPGAKINGTAAYTINGNATVHAVAADGAQVQTESITITLTGTPAFTFFVQCTRVADILMRALTFSGSATGARYSATMNGIIETGGGGASYFPGNSVGSTATGGQYA